MEAEAYSAAPKREVSPAKGAAANINTITLAIPPRNADENASESARSDSPRRAIG